MRSIAWLNLTKTLFLDDDDSEVKERSSNKQDSTDATFELFQIDVASLQQKIKENKLKTGKSNISAIGTSVSDA